MSDTLRDDPPVTVAITRRVRPEDEQLMQAWVEAGTVPGPALPGVPRRRAGCGPAPGSREWHMLYRFDSRASLLLWEESRERTSGCGRPPDLVQHTRVEHRTGIEGWFDEPAATAADDLASRCRRHRRGGSRP